MLDDREHSRRDEPRGTDDAARASQLADLDRRARAPYLNRPSGPRRLDCVLAGSARARVHQNFNKIAFCHVIFMPKSRRFEARGEVADGPHYAQNARCNGGC